MKEQVIQGRFISGRPNAAVQGSTVQRAPAMPSPPGPPPATFVAQPRTAQTQVSRGGDGQQLLDHEMAHVTQQRAGRVRRGSSPEDPEIFSGAKLKCSCGTQPSQLRAPADERMFRSLGPPPARRAGAPRANVKDHKPFANITTFGMCTSPSNPGVAATAASYGVSAPAPCVPLTMSPWLVGSPTVRVGSAPALTESSQLRCTWGGVISLLDRGPYYLAD